MRRVRLSDERVAQLEAMAKHHPARDHTKATRYNTEALRWIRDAEVNQERNEKLQRGYAAAGAM